MSGPTTSILSLLPLTPQYLTTFAQNPKVAIAAMTALGIHSYSEGLTLKGLGYGALALATPYLVSSPAGLCLTAAAVVGPAIIHRANYYNQISNLMPMNANLTKAAQDFVWSVPWNDYQGVIESLNILLLDMQDHEKSAFLDYLNKLKPEQKEDAGSLLAALVTLKVPADKRLDFCKLLNRVPASERNSFAYTAMNLGVPDSQRYSCYRNLRKIPANERDDFVKQANGFLQKLSSHTPPEAQTEVIRILSTIPKNDRKTFIQASSDLSIQNDLGRVQLMQELEKIKGKDRVAIAKTFNLVQQTLTKKEHEIDIDHKLEILTIATNLSEGEFKQLWEEAKKPFDLSSAHPWTLNAKITILERLSSTPAIIRNDVIRIASSQWLARDTTRILNAMSKLTPEHALHLKNDKYDIVALFADLTADEQKEFLEKMDKFPDPNDQKEIINILLENRGLLAKIGSQLPTTSSKTKSSSPKSERKTSSLIRDLNAFEKKRTPPAPAPVVTPAPDSPSLTRHRLADRPSVAPAPVSNGNQINGIQGHPVSSASSSSSSGHVPTPSLTFDRPEIRLKPAILPPPPVAPSIGPVKGSEGIAKSQLPPPLTFANTSISSALPLPPKDTKGLDDLSFHSFSTSKKKESPPDVSHVSAGSSSLLDSEPEHSVYLPPAEERSRSHRGLPFGQMSSRLFSSSSEDEKDKEVAELDFPPNKKSEKSDSEVDESSSLFDSEPKDLLPPVKLEYHGRVIASSPLTVSSSLDGLPIAEFESFKASENKTPKSASIFDRFKSFGFRKKKKDE